MKDWEKRGWVKIIRDHLYPNLFCALFEYCNGYVEEKAFNDEINGIYCRLAYSVINCMYGHPASIFEFGRNGYEYFSIFGSVKSGLCLGIDGKFVYRFPIYISELDLARHIVQIFHNAHINEIRFSISNY